MSFLYPAFLYGLFAVSIPIIIHFFNFRRYKIIYFSNIKFLQQVKSDSKTKSVIKNWLILLIRILIIASLVFAFAQPFIPVSENSLSENQKSVGIYIDNSFSTQSENKYGKIIENQKSAAHRIADAYPENQKFFFLNNNFDAKFSNPVTKEQLKEFITETETSAFFRKTTQIISQFKKFVNNFGERKSDKMLIYIISDFQKSSTDISEIQNDSSVSFVFVPSAINLNSNVYIDSVWFDNPNRILSRPDILNVSITNKSDKKYFDMPINLYLNDTIKTPSSFNIDENQTIIKSLDFVNSRSGIIKGKVEISDYPVIFDNSFYFSYSISPKKNILIISKNLSNKYIDAVIENNEEFTVSRFTENNIKTSDFKNFDVIIVESVKEISTGLSQELVNYCNFGGTLLIFPDYNCDIKNLNSFLSLMNSDFVISKDSSLISLKEINPQASLFLNVFENNDLKMLMPKIKKRFILSDKSKLDLEKILETENNEAVLSKYKINKGEFYLFTTPADSKNGNLVISPVWPPIIYNIIIYSDKNTKLYYTIGKNEAIIIKSKINIYEKNENVLHIKNSDFKIDIIPQTISSGKDIKLFIENEILKAGNYFVSNQKNDIQSISFNYDRKESELKYFSNEEITKILNSKNIKNFTFFESNDKFIGQKIEKNLLGKELYQYFILLTLFLILSEVLILKIIK